MSDRFFLPTDELSVVAPTRPRDLRSHLTAGYIRIKCERDIEQTDAISLVLHKAASFRATTRTTTGRRSSTVLRHCGIYVFITTAVRTMKKSPFNRAHFSSARSTAKRREIRIPATRIDRRYRIISSLNIYADNCIAGIIKMITLMTMYCSRQCWAPQESLSATAAFFLFFCLSGSTLFHFITAIFEGPGYLALKWMPVTTVLL